jgi:hypothetical protein
MTKIAHTAGPWFVSGDDQHEQPQIQAEAGGLVAIATHECVMPRTELDANARLIAAAPELLSLLQRWRALDAGAWHAGRHAGEQADLQRATDRLLAAIAQARPDQPPGPDQPPDLPRLVAALITVARMPNAEHEADAHNRAVMRLRALCRPET